jgi:sortase A
MGRDRRPAEELTIEELELLLARKKREARRARVDQFRRQGRAVRVRPDPVPISTSADFHSTSENQGDKVESQEKAGKVRAGFNRFLLVIEIGAVLGLAFVLLSGFDALKALNQEVSAAISDFEPTPTALITAVVLPSGHTPPTSPGGARPNDAEIPEHLRPMVQSMPAPVLPTASPAQAQRIFIPEIWDTAAPVVLGDGWEQLKRGVGQHVGSVNPGETGNLILSAHNDIFGELFRDLDRLKPGDVVIISTGVRDYEYRVTGIRIVEPTEVSVMEPTEKPTITLISCYPYLVDSQRIVVFGELVDV